jgi:hypothetical protein
MLALALATTFRLAVLPRVESRSVTPATSRGAAS